MLGWDWNRNQPKGFGIFGEPEAIFRADEEQGRTTLHAHILVWIKGFDKIREKLFHSNVTIREEAREKMRNIVDATFCSDYEYDEELPVIHEECNSSGPFRQMFNQISDLQVLRDGRNKMLASEVQGKVLECSHCKAGVSTDNMFDAVMKSYYKLSHGRDEGDMSDDTTNDQFQLDKNRMDIMTYRYPVDTLSEGGEDFYSNKQMRDHVATYRMNAHDWKHRKGCFKHGPECRFHFPKLHCTRSEFVEDADDTKKMKWRYVDGEQAYDEVLPYTIESKRSNGSQYLNTHSRAITEKFGCNSNVQMGSPRCVFYVVHYSTKYPLNQKTGVQTLTKSDIRLSGEL